MRRNKLSDFVDVRRSGIIAMKLAEGEGIVDVQICTEKDDVLLTSAGGQCIRFPVTDVRVFTGRTSMGVRGIALDDDDKLISMSILRHVDVTAGGARGLSQARQRGAARHGGEEEAAADAEEAVAARSSSASSAMSNCRRPSSSCSRCRSAATASAPSSYEYRITGRGGKGIVAMDIWEKQGRQFKLKPKIGRLVASFPVEEDDQIMLVTDGGKLIRCPVDGIRIAGRSTQGVIVFNTAEDEHVVSVERLSEDEGE